MPDKAILIIGTADTKSPEIDFLASTVRQFDLAPKIMDVGVLGSGDIGVDIDNQSVAGAAGSTLADIAALGDENAAMAKMAQGAGNLAAQLANRGDIHGVLILGGSMGTDLALDVTNALPLGFPKMILSTIAFSHLIPPDRLAPDLMMTLWAGGLYGINSICAHALRQAAAALAGAVIAAEPTDSNLPKVGITSFGKSAAKWMVRLVPELRRRGFEAVVFHATGMGGRAFEALAEAGEFVATMDFALQEVTNHLFHSVVTAGESRLTGAGRAGIPQLVAPGFIDLVDWPDWQDFPPALADRQAHSHNRLIASVSINAEERRQVVAEIFSKLSVARAPVAYLLPTQGVHEWDRAGEPLCDPEAIEAANEMARRSVTPAITLHELDCHINDDAFVDAALHLFDNWVAEGVVTASR